MIGMYGPLSVFPPNQHYTHTRAHWALSLSLNPSCGNVLKCGSAVHETTPFVWFRANLPMYFTLLASCINMLKLLELVNLTGSGVAERPSSVGGGNWIASVHIRVGVNLLYILEINCRGRGTHWASAAALCQRWVGVKAERLPAIGNLRYVCQRVG